MNILNKPFYVVTKPTKVSVIDDICFESTFEGLQKQFAGGLKFEDIVGIYDNKDEAKQKALSELNGGVESDLKLSDWLQDNNNLETWEDEINRSVFEDEKTPCPVCKTQMIFKGFQNKHVYYAFAVCPNCDECWQF